MQVCLSTHASFCAWVTFLRACSGQSSRTPPWSVHDLREERVPFDFKNGTWSRIYSWIVMALSWQRNQLATEISFFLLYSPFLLLWKGRKTKEACSLLQVVIIQWIPFWCNIAGDQGETQGEPVSLCTLPDALLQLSSHMLTEQGGNLPANGSWMERAHSQA